MYHISKLYFTQLTGDTHQIGLELNPRNIALEEFLISNSPSDAACTEFIDFLASKEKEWQLNYTRLEKVDGQNVVITLAEGLDDIEHSATVSIKELSALLSEWRSSVFRTTLLAFRQAKRH